MTVEVKARAIADPCGMSLMKIVQNFASAKEFKVLLCACNIYVCYLYYGFLHERIFKTNYDGEFFRFPVALVLMQCVTNALGAALVLPFTGNRLRDAVPLTKYALVSVSYLSAMVFSFSALQHMSFPFQVLGKSCKMIPVMLMGIVLRGRRYTMREYICVVLVTVGVATFSYRPKAASGHTTPTGIALLFVSLLMDGITGPYQEKLVAQYAPTTHQMMLWQNVMASGLLFIASVFTGSGAAMLRFLSAHPDAIRHVALFCIASALGQNFIFYTVRNVSALACTTITTTRKFFTLLASILLFEHKLNVRQTMAVVLVFTGIIWDTVAKFRAKASAKAAKAGAAHVQAPTSVVPTHVSASNIKKDL